MVGFRSFSLRALAYIQLIDEVHAFFSKYAFTVGHRSGSVGCLIFTYAVSF